jgi:DNA or RNA helicases of superfamily II
MELRPYQNEIISILEKDCQRPCKEIVQLPTGMGKTVVFSSLIRNLGKKTLILAHREELLNQAKDKMITCGVTGKIDIVLQSKPDPFADHWVASVQTLARRNLNDMSPELMIIDECHHSIATTYKRIMEAFSNIPIIGFTATPTRTGKKEKKSLARCGIKSRTNTT